MKKWNGKIKVYFVITKRYCCVHQWVNNELKIYSRRLYLVDDSTYRFKFNKEWYLVDKDMLY